VSSRMSVDVMVRLRDRLSGPLGRLKKTLSSFSSLIKRGAVGALAAFTAAITASITEAIKFQKLWDEANKTLGMSKPALQLLKDDLDELAIKIPLTRAEFVEMAEQAGNIGIRGREAIRDFIELAAKMGLTFDGVDPKQGAKFLGNWRESLGYTQTELEKTVDQINYLGNTTNAGAGPLAKYASDSLAIGDAAGYAREETLALGAAVIAAGKAPEIASTGFRAMNRLLTGGAANLTKAQKDITDSLGLDMDVIQKQMQTDATGAIRSVSEAISKMPIEERTSIVTRLFGDEAARVFGPLLGDITKLEKALARIDDLKKNSAGSAEAEFLGVSDNVLANWQKLKNVISKLRDEAGQPYLEPINNGLKTMIGYLTTLDERVTIFDRIGSSASGFFSGLGLGGLPSELDAVLERFTAIKEFIFGVADGPDPGEELAKGFTKAQAAGRRLSVFTRSFIRQTRDMVSSGREFGGSVLKQINRGLQETTNYQLPDMAKFLISKADAAGTFALAEGLTLMNVAWDGLKQLGNGFVKGFMDNIGEGLAGWNGLGQDVSELGTALGDFYASLKSLFGLKGEDMEALERLGEVFGILAAGSIGILGETLKLLATSLRGIVTAATELSNFLQGKPVDWNALKGAGYEILEQLGKLINAILDPLGKLIGMDLTIDWSSLMNGMKETLNEGIDLINFFIDKLNILRSMVGNTKLDHISKFDVVSTNPVAANDNIQRASKGDRAVPKVNMPGKIETKPRNYDARISDAFGSLPANTSGSGNVQKVEFAPLEHEVTSKVEVGGGVQISVTGPAKVTGVTSTNPNAPVTANTGRAVGRQ